MLRGLWKTKRRAEAAPPERQLVQRVLLDILEQRPKVRLDFTGGRPGVSGLSAVLVSVDALSIMLETSAATPALQKFVGKDIDCYVNLLDRKTNQRVFYTFSCQLKLVEFRKSGHTHVTMSLPQEMRPAQQRCGVRVQANQDRIPLFIAWREVPAGSPLSEAEPLFNSKCSGPERFRVENISSSGLCLVLQNEHRGEACPELSLGEVFTFYFKAVAEPGTPARAFLVNAALRNIYEAPKLDTTSLGFQFIANGGLDKHKRLVWMQLKSRELCELDSFIFKWDRLDFYRDKRI